MKKQEKEKNIQIIANNLRDFYGNLKDEKEILHLAKLDFNVANKRTRKQHGAYY